MSDDDEARNEDSICLECGQSIPLELEGIRVGARVRLARSSFASFPEGSVGTVDHFFLKNGHRRRFIVRMDAEFRWMEIPTKLMLRRDEFEVLDKSKEVVG